MNENIVTKKFNILLNTMLTVSFYLIGETVSFLKKYLLTAVAMVTYPNG